MTVVIKSGEKYINQDVVTNVHSKAYAAKGKMTEQ